MNFKKNRMSNLGERSLRNSERNRRVVQVKTFLQTVEKSRQQKHVNLSTTTLQQFFIQLDAVFGMNWNVFKLNCYNKFIYRHIVLIL